MPWTTASRSRPRLPYVAGVGVMVMAGTSAAAFGDLPWTGAVTIVQDLYLLTWAAALANFGGTAARAGFIVDVWCLSAAAWCIGLVVLYGPSTISGGDEAERAGFTFGEQNAAGLWFALPLLVMLAARRPRRWRWRALAIGAVSLDLLITGSLGAASGLFAGLAVALVLQIRARRGPDTAITFSLILLLAGSVALLAQRGALIETASQSPNPLIRNSIGRESDSESEHILVNQQNWGLTLEVVVLALTIWNPGRPRPEYGEVLPAPAYLVAGFFAVAVQSLTHEVLRERPLWTLLGVAAAFGLWGKANRWSLEGST